MKLSEVRGAYYQATGTASGLVNQLGLAAIAVVVLSRTTAAFPAPAQNLEVVLWLSVGALVFHYCQYAIHALVYGVKARSVERGQLDLHKPINNEEDVRVSPWMNAPAVVCFWTKLIVLAGAYGLLWSSVGKFLGW